MFRKLATLIFAAIPACLLLPLMLLLVGNAVENSQRGQFIYSTIALTIGLMAIFGVIGLFVVSFQENYKTRLNLFLVGCGTLTMTILFAIGLASNPSWFVPNSLGKDAFELLLLSSLLGFGIYYCFTIANKLFRSFGSGT